MTTNTATSRRIIFSTWQGSDIADGDQRDVLEEAIQTESRHGTHRESYTMGDGYKEFHAYVTDYTDPATSEKRYAACYEEPTGTEYIDFPTQAEAEAEYEEFVRGLQSCVQGQYDNDGEPAVWFKETDVENAED